MLSVSGAIALNRFGLGARPGDAVPKDAKRWLLDQLDAYHPAPRLIAGLESTATIARRHVELREQQAQPEIARLSREQYRAAASARIDNAVATDTPFAERLVHFWANHFAISADKGPVVPYAGSFEAEAIRPHILGKFEDLLFAVERHAGMMHYLDQPASVGPNSVRALKARAGKRVRGLNENLAREIMELHTLGVRTGYTQADVTEFARALTGWSVGGDRKAAYDVAGEAPGEFVFHPFFHEPGERHIMGKSYDQDGEAQGEAVLRNLASSPATAAHIGKKLAIHFAGDAPPPALAGRLATAFTKSKGHLTAVYHALVESQDSWTNQPVKFKTPWEWTISMLRGAGLKNVERPPIFDMLNQLGQPVWKPGSPAGWDDTAATWAAPDALMRRVEEANRIVTLISADCDPRELAAQLLPSPLSATTQAVIKGADTRLTGLALLFVSPEFQRR